MNKGEFVGGMLVQKPGQAQVMTLGGTPDDWVCNWVGNGQAMSGHFRPEELVPASSPGTP